MNVSDAVASRRSIRQFLDRPVDQAVLRRVLEKAQNAPSGGNTQPWNAVMITGEPLDRLKALVADTIPQGSAAYSAEYPVYPAELEGRYAASRFGVGEAMYASLGIPREDKAGRLAQFVENYRGFGAPVMLFLHCSRIMGPPQWADMGMWLQSVMLLLVEHGLASCPQECWAMYGATIRDELELGDDQILFTGLAIGHADAAAPVNQWPVPRAELDEVIDWQGF